MHHHESTAAPRPASRTASPGGASARADDRAGPSGLGGWLSVLGVWLVLTVLRVGWGWVVVFVAIPPAATWEMLTDPQTQRFVQVFVGLSLIGLTVLSVASVTALIGFFRRTRWFPRVLIGFIVANLVLEAITVTMGAVGHAWVFGDFELSAELLAELARKLAYPFACVAILTPYLLRSRRVRNTFVPPRTR